MGSLELTRAGQYEGGGGWRDSRFLEGVRSAGGRTIVLREIAQSSRPSPEPSPRRGEGPVVLSYSSISAYRDCPRQYWYRHVQRLPAVQSAEAIQGVILHETLRRAAEAPRKGADVTAPLVRAPHRAGRNEDPVP